MGLNRAHQELQIPLEQMRGIGPTRTRQLARHGLRTVGDLLYHLPLRYEDWRAFTPIAELSPGEQATAVAEIFGVHEVRPRRVGGPAGARPRRILEVRARDGTGEATLLWFHGANYGRARFNPGQHVVVHGRVEEGPKFIHPEVEILPEPPSKNVPGEERRGRIVPVYTSPTGMPKGLMRRVVRTAVEQFGAHLQGMVPAEIASRQGLMEAKDALEYLHLPPGDADIGALHRAETLAHRTLIFGELFCLQLAMALKKAAARRSVGTALSAPSGRTEALRRCLPFQLTGAQERVIAEIHADMASPRPMRRVVLGDVGCGKTVVALFASVIALDAGYSAAVMAPTEVLAEQHLATFEGLLVPLGVRPLLLTGGLKAGERRTALSAIASGAPVLVIGTHALIQEKVRFPRLGIAIIDEQHRFGVVQRRRLAGGGSDTAAVEQAVPDTLVMTATPIPRTLAMAVYGDLDVSYVDELPAGRQRVTTRVIADGDRDGAYAFARGELAKGRQVFVVFPLVEDSEATPLRAATAMVTELRTGSFDGYAVGLVHGRMRSDERDETMRRFKAGVYQVLVCTTVVEVGIDIPNATAMVIEHADRFGLAQLHQLRGRVGRGSASAACCLIASSLCTESGLERLRVLEETHDGLRIAEADLRIRGPGEFLGSRQAGLPELRVASLLRDAELLDTARGEANRFLVAHPDLDTATWSLERRFQVPLG